jgi:hypothetical protein
LGEASITWRGALQTDDRGKKRAAGSGEATAGVRLSPRPTANIARNSGVSQWMDGWLVGMDIVNLSEAAGFKRVFTAVHYTRFS